MAFTFERADGSTRTVSGYRSAKPKAGSKSYQTTDKKLPAKVDLRKQMTEIEDQGEVGSCVANATAGAYEYLAKMHTGEDYDVSRMFIYYNARYLESDEDEPEIEDSGCLVQDAIEGLKQYGACSEETYPYNVKKVNKEPPSEAYDEAANFVVEDMVHIPLKLEAWKGCLAEGYPIIFGLELFDSFDKQRKKGMVPMPSKNEERRASHEGHAMLAVGYSDVDEVFIIRNSWGEEWGDKGYCYIPYDYMMNKKYNDGDAWIIRQLENMDFNSDEYWSDDDESVIGDYDSELANMSDENYEEMLDAMGDYSLEYRIALLFLAAADADGDLSDEELEAISEYMEATLEKLGVDMSAKKILRNAKKHMDDEDLLEESISLMGQYLSNEMLAKIHNDLEEVIGVDDLSDEESEFIENLVEQWQIDSEDEEDEDDEEDDEDDEEDEDEDGEEDDEEEDDEDDEEDDE